ncbi:MAG: ABC transporter permease [Bacteroidota bacterium]
MNKLWLIVQREYLVRVRKTSFILATILTPLGIGLIAFVSGYLASSSMNSQKKIALIDESGFMDVEKMSNDQYLYTKSLKNLSDLKEDYIEEGYDLVIQVPKLEDLKAKKHVVNFYSSEKLSLISLEKIERGLSRELKNYKISKSDIDQETLDQLEINVSMENANVSSDDGTNADQSSKSDKSSKMSIIISSILSYVMGFLMYIVIFVYGSMVMRSVMEEKINRIVEVVISSVKPFTLMLGKVMGVGLVGLTQLMIWMILIPTLLFVVSATMGLDNAAGATSADAAEVMKQMEDSGAFNLTQTINEIKQLNWLLILPSFVVFFLGGYFIYSSLFAAVGSAIGDDLGEGQQLMMPIIIPVILAFVMVPAVFNDPDGPIAVFGSMFPLFSPIVMPARLPFDPPIWQVLLSIAILVASVVFMTWMAGRIYRVGILMYGKKVNFKELGKWLFYKG